MDINYIDRHINNNILEAIRDTPVIFLSGPRQTGKTTLVRKLAEQLKIRYITLDDDVTLLAAQHDPSGFIQSIDRAVIDEIQRAPKLLMSIKKNIDENRLPGRFLLTGSANLMALPKVADSLAGRMETLRLYPLSQSEINGNNDNWIDAAFANIILENKAIQTYDELVNIVLTGGYPEMLNRTSPKRRSTWARQYIEAIVLRDVQDIAEVGKLDALPRLLQALGHNSGQLCNYSRLGAELGLNHKTVASYMDVFEHMFLLKRVPAWAKTGIKRLIKTPKIQFLDSGLLASLIGVNSNKIDQNRTVFGNLLETFVYAELLKHTTTAEDNYKILYYRDTEKVEVDFIIENSMGDSVAIEVKAAVSIQPGDLLGLKRFSDLVGHKLKLSLILYAGDKILPLGDNIWAVPVSSLWGKRPT